MSNIIQLLEKMGNDASLLNKQQLSDAINQADINTELKQALIERNANKLAEQVDDCPEIRCVAIAKPDDAPDEQPEPTEPEQTPQENLLVANG